MKEPEKFLAEIERLAEKWDLSAALCLQEGPELFYEKAFGYADRAQQRPLTLTDRFPVSAHGGFFLALCLMRLQDEGKLRLTDKIHQYLPEYKHAPRIAITHLLHWDAGIPDEWSHLRMPEMQKDPAHAALSDTERFQKEYAEKCRDLSFAQVLERIGEMDLTHDPGKEDDSSNAVPVFLAEIVKRVSGRAPREYLLQEIFAPLDMEHTVPGSSETVARQGAMRDEVLVPLPRVDAAHVFTTTLQDMNRLARALAEKRLFSEKTLQRALRGKWNFGLGFGKAGELYYADTSPNLLGESFRLYLNFEEGLSILILQAEDMIARRENQEWLAFAPDMRRAWQYARMTPKEPRLKRVNQSNVWDAMTIRILPAQHSFVPDAKTCLAYTLARRQPAYVLMDRDMPVGLACLNINRKKKEYEISFLQVDERVQGRGYGRILLTRAVEILKEKGAETLEIGVNRFNLPAQRLYRSVGFRDEDVYEGYISLKMNLK